VLSPGIRNPHHSVIICLVVALLSWASIAWGIMEMTAAGQETMSSGLKIGLALLPAIIAPLFALNFWSGMKVIARIRRGEGQIARWTVSAADLAAFVTANKARNALGAEQVNDWSPPREPTSGIEVVFVPDGVLVGDTYFSLVTIGPYSFTQVWLLTDGAPAVAFRTRLVLANRFGMRTTIGELRIPAPSSASADAAKVVAHFQQVSAGTVIANPDFYRSRMRIGLIGAPIFLAIAALGFVLGPNDMSNGDISIPSLMIIIGLVAGVGMLILALAAKLLDGAQRRKRP
jgi:hypothetical protein